MANIMALVSKAGRKDIERDHEPIAPGEIVGITAYHSKHGTLESLEAGGSLFMVTVDDGKLLVVAVLHNPHFDGTSWTATPNEVPVLDISDLVPELEFSTGKGLKVPPEKWAMSLQTPRELSDGDVARLRARTAPSAGAAFQAVMADHLEPPAAAKGRKRSRPSVRASDAILDWPAALATVEAWSALKSDARHAALQQIADTLNQEREKLDQKFEVDQAFHGVARLGALIHSPSGLTFIAVPGGAYYMGYAADDVLATTRVLTDDEVREVDDPGQESWAFRSARPPHLVTVRPFLTASGLVDEESLCEATGREDVGDAMEKLGFRHPSEAEWEWIGREGGPVQFVGLPVDRHPLGPTISPPLQYDANGWGFGGLHNETQACADGWHDSYVGAPSTSQPWPGPDGISRSAHTWWQDHREAQALHAAARGYKGGGTPRLTLDLPDTEIPVADQPQPASTCDETLEAFATRGVDRQRALIAIAATTSIAGPDTASLVDWLLGNRDKPTKAAWLDALSLVARVAGNDPTGALANTVAARFDALSAMLKDKKPAVRAAASALLSTAGEDVTQQAFDALKAELELERRHTLRDGILLALATLRCDGIEDLLRSMTSHKEAVVRSAAVIGLAWVLGPDALSEDEQEEVAMGTGLSREKPEDLPWAAGQIAALAQELLDQFSDGEDLRRRAALEMAKKAAADKTQWKSADLALKMAFSNVAPPSSLDDTQREIITLLTEAGGTNRWNYGHLPIQLLDRLTLIGKLAYPGLLERAAELQLGNVTIELPLLNAHIALFHHAESNGWSDERMAAANRELFGELTLLDRLEIWMQSARGALSKQRKVDGNWQPFGLLGLDIDRTDGSALIAEAVAQDRQAVRDLVERLVQINLAYAPAYTTQNMGWTALAAALEPGEQLPEHYWDIVPLAASTPHSVLFAIPEDVRARRIQNELDAAIKRVPSRVAGHFLKNTLHNLSSLVAAVGDKDNVRVILGMAAVVGASEEREMAIKAVAGIDAPWTAELLDDFRAHGDLDIRDGRAVIDQTWAYLEKMR